MGANGEDFFSVLNLPEEHLDIDDLSNVENRPVGRNRGQNRRIQGFSRDRSTNNRPATSWRTDRADRDSSYRTSKNNGGFWKNRNLTDGDSSNETWRKRAEVNPINDDENDSSGAESTASRSSTFSVPSYPRSSSRRQVAHKGKEQTNWRDRNFKANEKRFEFNFGDNRNGKLFKRDDRNDSDRSDRFDKNSRRDDRNASYRSDKLREPNNGDEFSRPEKPNRRGDENESSRPERPNRELFIGYKYLKSLSEKEPHEMICDILRPKANIDVVLKRKELQIDWIILILETVRKLCESDFKSNRAQVLQYFCESPLIEHVSHYLGEIGMEKNQNTIRNLASFISDLITFYSAVIHIIPTVALDKNFDRLLTKTKIGIDQMKMYLKKEIDETIVEKLANLEKILEDETKIRDKKVERPRRKYLEIVGDMPPPDDFRDLSLYPTQEDLNRPDFGFVRPNKIRGAYEDVNHYLDVQFRLIREDFIDPLRRGLRNYKDAVALHGKPKYKYESVRLYPNTRFENIEVTKNNEVAYVVNFNVSGRLKIKWEYSKRFMFGSLLLFTRDNFESFFFATVFNRDLEKLKKGHILVTLIGSEPLEQQMLNQSFVMAESEVYFEPYCLVMKALKEYNEDDFPMKQFIVDGDTTVNFPRYMLNLETFDIYEYPVNMIGNVGWPVYSSIGFDEHQFNAFKTALTSNFTVIQGPPGTGKTYLGLKIVEVLLKNIVNHDAFVRTPILLVCYTNHALDQFLEGILKFTQRIVRVGGQSKSDELKPYNLRGRDNLNYLRREARKLYPAMNHCREEMRRILFQLKKKTEEKKLIEFPQGILSYRILSDVMNSDFKRIIKDDQTLLSWLLDISSDPFIENSPKRNIVKDDTVNLIEPMEIDEEIYPEEEEETMEADILVNEDDVFDAQEVNPGDMSVRYCLTAKNLEESFIETRKLLEILHPRLFEEYSEYYNREHQLREDLRILELQFNILNHFLQNAELDSSLRFNTRHQNLSEIPLDLRWSFYWTWVSQLKQIFDKELKDLEAKYRLKSHQYEELKQLEDFHVVKNSLVVGMTTTCAARLQLLLKTLSPAIVIVEEAAEVLEAHIVVSLSKNCEHVILIGDHKQLKPSTAVYELSKKYNINVSLFERMINNHMYCPQLQIQHRMRPEISSLIVPSIYPDLKNHESVLKYPSVTGITKNLFFVEHNVYEEKVEDSSSRKNRFEADFTIQLCRYILLQGYAAEQITILTTYTGQMFLLREIKRDYVIMKDVKVIVVDKYQGEENDIILLSLVRSNEERKIGFLSIENRVCVALSRAKIGLYIIGNMDILSDSSLWKNIKEELTKQGAIGSKLMLYCDKHDIYTPVSSKSDFSKVLEGGCNNFCLEILDCGHKCQLLCHKIDMEHLEKKCREKCLKKCIERHPCHKYCYEDCGQCFEPIERTLPCGHKITLSCFKDYQNYPCQEEVSVVLEHCSHEVKKKCFQSIDQVKCTFPCEDRLECGHQCVRNCHKTEDPDHLEYKCHKPCDKINRGCSKEHKCEKFCFEDCGKCKVRIDFKLTCGHQINLQCSANVNKVNCYNPCERKCAECNAKCRKKCYEDCKPCMNKVKKIIPDCGHKKKMECSVVPERKLCVEKCRRMAPCGHECKSICGEDCGTEKCQKIVKSSCVQALCGHGLANVPCWRKNETIDAEELLQYCTEPCVAVLKCGDLCTGTCGSCWQGRLHQTCEQKCGNVLVCGHSCTYPCRNVCPPCTKKCQYECKHSKCPKDCGVPCVHCKEECEWKCFHYECTKKCGAICDRPPCYEPCKEKLPCEHDCIGFCGEPCPPKCRICDEDEVKMILFGDEDEDDARWGHASNVSKWKGFVLLEDCGHFIESKAMDKYISMPAEKGEIVMKLCPLCKTPISKTLRYMNQVKKVYRDILNVKKKIYGNEREMTEIRRDLTKKLQNLDLKNSQLYKKGRFDFEAFRRDLLHQIPENVNNKANRKGCSELKSLLIAAETFISITNRMNDNFSRISKEELKTKVMIKLTRILLSFKTKRSTLKDYEVEFLDSELRRLYRFMHFYIIQCTPKFIDTNWGTSDDFKATVKLLESVNYSEIVDNNVEVILKRFDQLESGLTVREKESIRQALQHDLGYGAQQGHWYSCRCGYVYTVANCGRFNQSSKCPKCKNIIGSGSSNTYVASNYWSSTSTSQN